MPSTNSQQQIELQEDLEEKRRLATLAAARAAAQQEQTDIQTQQNIEQTAAAPTAPAVPESQNGAANAAATQEGAATPAGTDNVEVTDNGTIEEDHTISDAMRGAHEQIEKNTDDAYKANDDARNNYLNFLGRVVEGYQNDLREAKKEAELQKQIDTNKNVFAGVTEFASALVNLIGTSRGAVNQQPKTYTQDWMREADQHRLQERERLDRMRDKLRQQEMAGENAKYQLTKEQIAEQLNLKNLKQSNAIALAGQIKAEKDEAYERSRNVVTDELKAKGIEAQMRGQDVELERIARMDRADETRLQIEQLKQGLVPDGNGGYTYEPYLAAKKMGAQALEIPAYGERNAVVTGWRL